MYKKFAFIGALFSVLSFTGFSCAIESSQQNRVENQDAREDLPDKPTMDLIKVASFLTKLWSYSDSTDKEFVDSFWNDDCLRGENTVSEVTLDDSLRNILLELIEREKEEARKGNVVLYHALNGFVLFAYKYFGSLLPEIDKQPSTELLLRGNKLQFTNPDTNRMFESISEVRKHCGVSDTGSAQDYLNGISRLIMHTNLTLSAGSLTSDSKISSVALFCGNGSFNWSKSGVMEMISDELVLRGLPLLEAKQCAKEVIELFEKYYLIKADEINKAGGQNNGLLAISVPYDKLDEVAVNAVGGGAIQNNTPSVMTVLKNLHSKTNAITRYVKAKDNCEKIKKTDIYALLKKSFNLETRKESKPGELMNKDQYEAACNESIENIMNDANLAKKTYNTAMDKKYKSDLNENDYNIYRVYKNYMDIYEKWMEDKSRGRRNYDYIYDENIRNGPYEADVAKAREAFLEYFAFEEEEYVEDGSEEEHYKRLDPTSAELRKLLKDDFGYEGYEGYSEASEESRREACCKYLKEQFEEYKKIYNVLKELAESKKALEAALPVKEIEDRKEDPDIIQKAIDYVKEITTNEKGQVPPGDINWIRGRYISEAKDKFTECKSLFSKIDKVLEYKNLTPDVLVDYLYSLRGDLQLSRKKSALKAAKILTGEVQLYLKPNVPFEIKAKFRHDPIDGAQDAFNKLIEKHKNKIITFSGADKFLVNGEYNADGKKFSADVLPALINQRLLPLLKTIVEQNKVSFDKNTKEEVHKACLSRVLRLDGEDNFPEYVSIMKEIFGEQFFALVPECVGEIFQEIGAIKQEKQFENLKNLALSERDNSSRAGVLLMMLGQITESKAFEGEYGNKYKDQIIELFKKIKGDKQTENILNSEKIKVAYLDIVIRGLSFSEKLVHFCEENGIFDTSFVDMLYSCKGGAMLNTIKQYLEREKEILLSQKEKSEAFKDDEIISILESLINQIKSGKITEKENVKANLARYWNKRN